MGCGGAGGDGPDDLDRGEGARHPSVGTVAPERAPLPREERPGATTAGRPGLEVAAPYSSVQIRNTPLSRTVETRHLRGA